MRIPYVIDNEEHRLADVLNQVLAEHAGRSLDVASAYFTVGGYAQVRERLAALGSFRLLLGAEPAHGADIGLRSDAGLVPGLMKRDLDCEVACLPRAAVLPHPCVAAPASVFDQR